jgi:DNA-binding XRE family transcriptional regulator
VTVSAKELGFDVTGVESMPRRRLPPPKPLDEGTLPDDYKAIFAHNFQVARVKAGMRQEDVAQAANVTKAYIQHIESGSENLTIDTMKRLSEVVRENLLNLLRKDFNRAGDSSSLE